MRVVYSRYTKIKYDRLNQKWSLIVAILATVLSCIINVFAYSSILDGIETKLLVFILIGGYIFFPILSMIGWIDFAMNTVYLKRLRAYGYETPQRQREYKGLEELPRSGAIETKVSVNSRESMALAVICWVAAAGCMFGSVPLLVRYQMYGGLVFHGGVALFWVILGIYYFRQRSREKYRDDVEPEVASGDSDKNKPRKVRTQFEEGLVPIVVLLILTILFLIIIYFLGGVIFRARLAGGAGV